MERQYQNEDSPIVIEEWKNKVVYWERVLDTLDEIYNDHRIIDGSDSSFEDFWPKIRHVVDVDRNALHVISSIMDEDFDNAIDEPHICWTQMQQAKANIQSKD